ncbi:MAG TPA: hypothetical protein VGK19_14430 [Capsulimonadaceae bacterium]|jgi:hypothetical protein
MSTTTKQPATDGAPRIKRLLGILFGTLHMLAFALWFGGVIAIGALVAPAISHVLHNPPPQLDFDILKSTLTTGIIGQALLHFNIVCYVAAVLMLLADIVELSIYPGGVVKIATLVRAAVTVALFATALYLGQSLTPQMDLMLAGKNMAAFDDLHKQYEMIVKLVQTPLLFAIPIITMYRNARLTIK